MRILLASLSACLLISCSGSTTTDGGSGGGAGGGGGGAGDTVPDLTKTTAQVNKTSATASGFDNIDLSFVVKNSAGTPLGGVPIAATITGTGNEISGPGNTNGDGTVVLNVRSTKAETKTLTAQVGVNGTLTALPSTFELTFVAGPGTDIGFVTQPTNTKAGVVMTPAVVLELRDGQGNHATGTQQASVRLVRSSGGSVSNGEARASVDGFFTFDMLTINRPQTGYALRAEIAGGPASESVQFDVSLGDFTAATSTFVANPVNVVANGTDTSTLTFTARDGAGNPLPGEAVTVTVSGTGNTLGVASGTTAAGGVFTTTLASTVQEAKTVTATVGSNSLTVTVTFIP